ncbi:glycosyltransferase family 39 protein [Actinospica durhamensis]|uniref:Glycosyltransferase family 39 protein n=1 Tax=Actinospica durhamensis TaxID=1508375 RepID=A0A941ENM3_9ACTN|nr:glycosyltransferase family 39 protein [Actinospica durhamensis]MBR7832344.1 glycosyltransferase family 39 protein [Actinospica durhamensis]
MPAQRNDVEPMISKSRANAAEGDAQQSLEESGRERSADVPRPRRPEQPANASGGNSRIPLLLLLLILAVQCGISLWLIHANGMFEDEGTYAYDGHELWQSWFDHVPNTSNYSKILSGVPDFYPIISAGLDKLGGLFAIRLFSCAMMLVSTSALYSFTRRLYGPRAAVIAAALFALLQPTTYMGAFGTYDAMALALLSLAALCALRSTESRFAWLWIFGVFLCCFLADSAKYAAALWNAPVFAVLLFASVPYTGWRKALIRTFAALAGLCALIGAGLALGGADLRAGIAFTTTQRAAGTTPASLIYHDTMLRLGIVLIAALLGLAFAALSPVSGGRFRTPGTLLAASLIVAGLLAPINQARIDTNVAFPKHLGFGAWFTAALAGFGIAAFFAHNRSRTAANLVTAAAVLASGLYGTQQAHMLFQTWGNAQQAVQAMKPYISKGNARYLAEDDPVEQYYLRNQTNQSQWYNTWSFSFRDPHTGAHLSGTPAYVDAIKHEFFSVVELLAVNTEDADKQMATQLSKTKDYVLVAKVPLYENGSSTPFSYYYIWALHKHA